MNTVDKMGPTSNEMNLIYDAFNGVIPSFDYLNWKGNEISRLMEVSSRNGLYRKWDVDFVTLIKKLLLISEIEVLEILDDVKNNWGVSDENYYLLGSITPKRKIAEIKSEMSNDILDSDERP